MTKDLSPAEQSFKKLKALLKEKKPEFDLKRIERAFEFAREGHEGQFRMSGDPYIIHPCEVASILCEFPVDEDTIIAAILHDVPEDTHFTIEDVESRFGGEVGNIVNALTKLSKVYYKHSMSDRQVQSLRKMFLEVADDPRVVIVKLADRLHNMSTLRYLRPDKQQRIAKETLEIYAPLANLYGIYQLRWQLEDLCFIYLQPEEYSRIESFVQGQAKEQKAFIEDTIKIITKHLKKDKIEVDCSGRSKHFYSIYRKMLRDQKSLNEIYDYLAIRVVVNTNADAYRALGIIHEMFTPKINRFKDYIALPKPNGYQSLHTTVIGLKGQLTEVQIRTKEMHYEAEFGGAAHSLYKEERTALTESINLLKGKTRPEAIIRMIQDDILQKKIFVFSPKGEVINLPEGSTALDYIFATNLSVEKSFRVTVNNAAHSITGTLKSGDHIEVIYSKVKQDGPERWWLDHVKTAKAQEAIQSFFKKSSLEKRIKLGEGILQQALDHENKGLVYQLPESAMKKVCLHFNVESFADLLAQIGEGSLSVNSVYKELFPIIEERWIDKIIKFFRFIFRKISPSEDYQFRIKILIEAYDRVGLLQEALSPFYDLKIPITKLKTNGHDVPNAAKMKTKHGVIQVNPDYKVKTKLNILISDHETLITLFDRIEKIPGVLKVQRIFRIQQMSFTFAAGLVLIYVMCHPWILMWVKSSFAESSLFLHGSIYLGYFSILGLMLWLRSMGNKTFPHFEETKYFWPLPSSRKSIVSGSLPS